MIKINQGLVQADWACSYSDQIANKKFTRFEISGPPLYPSPLFELNYLFSIAKPLSYLFCEQLERHTY